MTGLPARRATRWPALAFALVAAIVAIAVAASPSTGAGAVTRVQDADEAMVTNIYEGDCETPSPPAIAGSTVATPEAGATSDRESYSFATRLEQPLADFVATPHAILVERSDGELFTTIACGRIEGDGSADRLVIGLFSAETGGLAGVAVATVNDDGGTSIAVFLVLSAGGAPLGPVSEPADLEDEPDGVLDEPQEPSDEQDGVEGGV